MPKPFRLVRFPEEQDSIAVVPSSWVTADGQICLWPPTVKDAHRLSLVKSQTPPGNDWRGFPTVVMARCSSEIHSQDECPSPHLELAIHPAQGSAVLAPLALPSFEEPQHDDCGEVMSAPGSPGPAPQASRSFEEPQQDQPSSEMSVLLRVLRLLIHVRQQNRDTMQELCLLRNEVQLLSQRLDQAEAADRSLVDPATCTAFRSAASARKHLLSIGGKGLREVAVNAMKAVMGHDVQVRYSLHGRKGKLAFIQLKLCTIVTDAICQKANLDLCTARDFIKRWLPGSINCSGGRKRRFAEALMSEQPDDPCPRSRDPESSAPEGRDHQQPTLAAFLASRCHQRPGQTTSASFPLHSAPPPSASFTLQPQPIEK
ncbi:hypothetical protein HPB50_027889 [Hyalomma asiaticum]|nr:hypothetical protein HPB50_027889 [Hyalomma asiaticum]